jgi:hypothetical protein
MAAVAGVTFVVALSTAVLMSEKKGHPSAGKPAPKTVKAGPNSALIKETIDSGDIVGLKRQLGEKLSSVLLKDGEPVKMVDVVSVPAVQASLAQYELIRCCGDEKISDIISKPGGREFMKKFLNDVGWVESFLWSGPPADSFSQSLENLYVLSQNVKGLDKAVYRRLATAMALQAGKTLPYRYVNRFNQIQQAFKDGLMHSGYDTMDVRQMRPTICLVWCGNYYNSTDFQFLVDDLQCPIDDPQNSAGSYFGAAWSVRYLEYNVYGDSIQAPLYYRPWDHAYDLHQAYRIVGGVCGSLSTYAAHVAQVHGVMSIPVGQPGHCAYVIRSGEEWPVAYDVNWPTSFSVSGWEGTGHATANKLFEPVYTDKAKFEPANRMCWAAKYLDDSKKPSVRIQPEIKYSLYKSGVGAQLPDFSKLTPDRTGVVSTIDLAKVQPVQSQYFGVVWEGRMDISTDGQVKVAIHADDGSRLLLDGRPVVSATGARQEVVLDVKAGPHDFKLEYYQISGPQFVTMEVEGVAKYGNWVSVYEQAIQAQPLNYGIWVDYIKALQAAPDTPTHVWSGMAKKASGNFVQYQEAAWGLILKTLDKALPAMTPEQRMSFMVELNMELRQEKAPEFVNYPYDVILNWQVDHIGDPLLAMKYFERMLHVHSAPPPNNLILAQVLSWGKNRFAGNTNTAPQFAKVIESYFSGKGTNADVNLARTQIVEGIRNACAKGEIPTFKLWNDIAGRVLPKLKPGDVYLGDVQAAAYPRTNAFSGELLSKDAILKVNDPSVYDIPLSYERILTGNEFGGYFEANLQDKPHATVQLKGDSELTGIALVNRYEHATQKKKLVPLVVLVSRDGNDWKEVARLEKTEDIYRIDLTGKKPTAKYIRIQHAGVDKNYLHLRGILIYGKKLY